MIFGEDLFEEIERMHRKIHRLMQRMWYGAWEPISEEIIEPITARLGTFPVDIVETDDELIVRADLPGFDKNEIVVRTRENTLEISAQRKEKKIEKTEKMFHAERKFGSVRRLLTLPTEVLPETSKATFENGVLEVRFKKAKPTKKGKEIKIE